MVEGDRWVEVWEKRRRKAGEEGGSGIPKMAGSGRKRG